MKISAIALLLLAASCQPSTAWRGVAMLGEQFELPVGGTFTLAPSGLKITFRGVVSDTRCPQDVECFWEGAAKVELGIAADSGQPAAVMLSTVWGPLYVGDPAPTHFYYRHSIDTLGYRITLLEVSPYPEYHDRPIPPEDYAVRLHAVPSWSEESINLLSSEMTGFFEVHGMDDFDIRDTGIDGDSLVVTVRYGGGCEEHDFYLLGNCAWVDADPPLMQAVLLHNGHGDACKALITRQLKIDLAPLRSCAGAAGLGSLTIVIGDTGLIFDL